MNDLKKELKWAEWSIFGKTSRPILAFRYTECLARMEFEIRKDLTSKEKELVKNCIESGTKINCTLMSTKGTVLSILYIPKELFEKRIKEIKELDAIEKH